MAKSRVKRKDPTATKTLRSKFSSDATRRFGELKGDIIKAIVEQDALGLAAPDASLVGLAAVGPGERAFAFRQDSEKVADFSEWLAGRVDERILETTTGPISGTSNWSDKYITGAYRKGLTDSYINAGKIGALDDTVFEGLTSQEFARQAFNSPMHADRVALLQTRAFTDLKGITRAMDSQISRTMAEGIANGLNPRQMARQLTDRVDKIGITRAKTLAQTETIRAHADASLNSYEQMGLEGVSVFAEWDTAGDDRVCPLCIPLEGVIMPIKEARGLIPRHPNCRCAWLPADEDKMPGQKRGASATQAWQDSIARETGTKPTEAQTPDPVPTPAPAATPKPKTSELPKKVTEDPDAYLRESLGTDVYNEGKLSNKRFGEIKQAMSVNAFSMEKLAPNLVKKSRGAGALKSVDIFSGKNLPGRRGIYGTYYPGQRKYAELAGGHNLPMAEPTIGRQLAGKDFNHIFRHEAAHSFWLRSKTKRWREFFKSKPSSFFKKNVSVYAATDPEEAFAEAFAVLSNPQYKVGMLNEEIESILKEVIE
jgi:SPP1 gp7 family putative phage head morphogenesis protein